LAIICVFTAPGATMITSTPNSIISRRKRFRQALDGELRGAVGAQERRARAPATDEMFDDPPGRPGAPAAHP